MATSELRAFMSAARSCAMEMLSNAMYIEREMPTLDVPEAERLAVAEVCGALIGTKHDILTELQELDELGEPADGAGVRKRVERIVRWLGEEPPKLHAVVSSLVATGAVDGSHIAACILLGESAANVYRAYAVVAMAADEYWKAVGGQERDQE